MTENIPNFTPAQFHSMATTLQSLINNIRQAEAAGTMSLPGSARFNTITEITDNVRVLLRGIQRPITTDSRPLPTLEALRDALTESEPSSIYNIINLRQEGAVAPTYKQYLAHVIQLSERLINPASEEKETPDEP